MFTGIVQSLARVVDVVSEPPGVRIVIHGPFVAMQSKIGDSVAVNGCCLTVVHKDGDRLTFQAGEETLSLTNLGELKPNDEVNLEGSLRLGDAVGGHFVTGHVDALGTVESRDDDAEWCTMWIRMPPALASQMVRKGSITVDGVSLTLVDVKDDRFSVALIPHTLQQTTLGRRQVGDRVNLETDQLAKFVQEAVRYLRPGKG